MIGQSVAVSGLHKTYAEGLVLTDLDLSFEGGAFTAEPRQVCRRLQLLSKVEHHEQDNEQVFP